MGIIINIPGQVRPDHDVTHLAYNSRCLKYLQFSGGKGVDVKKNTKTARNSCQRGFPRISNCVSLVYCGTSPSIGSKRLRLQLKGFLHTRVACSFKFRILQGNQSQKISAQNNVVSPFQTIKVQNI